MTENISSTKDRVGTYDAIETLKPGEPVFPLQGGDPLAPLLVLIWAWKARKLARTLDRDKDREKLLRKATAAEELAWEMKEYQNGEGGGSIADIPEPAASYGGAVVEKAGDWLPHIVSGVRHLKDAAAELHEATAHLPPDQARALSALVDAVNVAAEKYAPKRASYPAQPDFPKA